MGIWRIKNSLEQLETNNRENQTRCANWKVIQNHHGLETTDAYAQAFTKSWCWHEWQRLGYECKIRTWDKEMIKQTADNVASQSANSCAYNRLFAWRQRRWYFEQFCNRKGVVPGLHGYRKVKVRTFSHAKTGIFCREVLVCTCLHGLSEERMSNFRVSEEAQNINKRTTSRTLMQAKNMKERLPQILSQTYRRRIAATDSYNQTVSRFINLDYIVMTHQFQWLTSFTDIQATSFYSIGTRRCTAVYR